MRDGLLAPDFGVVPSPALAVAVVEADPKQVVLGPVVHDEVRQSGALGRVQRDWWVKLQDHVASPLIFEMCITNLCFPKTPKLLYPRASISALVRFFVDFAAT